MTGPGAGGKDVAAEARAESARVMLLALDVLEAAAGAVTPELAVPGVREVLARLDEDQVRAVAVALAVEGVWFLPPMMVAPRTAGEIRWRLAQIRGWVHRVRLEALWSAS